MLQARDGIRDLVRSRGFGDVYKRQMLFDLETENLAEGFPVRVGAPVYGISPTVTDMNDCLLYTSDAADERSSVDLGGRRIIKQKNNHVSASARLSSSNTNTI